MGDYRDKRIRDLEVEAARLERELARSEHLLEEAWSLIASQEEQLVSAEGDLSEERRKAKRAKIWSKALQCPKCKRGLTLYTCAVGTTIHQDQSFEKLRAHLRSIGVFLKERCFDEQPPKENKKAQEKDYKFLPPRSGDIRDIPIPDALGPEVDE